MQKQNNCDWHDSIEALEAEYRRRGLLHEPGAKAYLQACRSFNETLDALVATARSGQMPIETIILDFTEKLQHVVGFSFGADGAQH